VLQSIWMRNKAGCPVGDVWTRSESVTPGSPPKTGSERQMRQLWRQVDQLLRRQESAWRTTHCETFARVSGRGNRAPRGSVRVFHGLVCDFSRAVPGVAQVAAYT